MQGGQDWQKELENIERKQIDEAICDKKEKAFQEKLNLGLEVDFYDEMPSLQQLPSLQEFTNGVKQFPRVALAEIPTDLLERELKVRKELEAIV